MNATRPILTPQALAIFRSITLNATRHLPTSKLRDCIREAKSFAPVFDGGMAAETAETRAWSEAERGYRAACHAITQAATTEELLNLVDEVELHA